MPAGESIHSLLRGIDSNDLRTFMRAGQLNDVGGLTTLKNKYTSSINALDKQIKDATKQLNGITDVERVVSFVADSQPAFTEILIKLIGDAFKTNSDLNLVSYVSQLNRLVSEGGFISVLPTVYQVGANKSDTVISWKVDIYQRMLKFLGGPDDYANAVKATRSALNYGDKQRGEQASLSWYYQAWKPARVGIIEETTKYKNLYKKKVLEQTQRLTEGKIKRRGKIKFSEKEIEGITKTVTQKAEFYDRIMKTRLLYLEDKAPYWYLLNHGSVSLSSDKGGRAIPLLKPTNFVRVAEQRVAEYCSSNFSSYQSADELNLKDDIEKLSKLLRDSREIVKVLDQLIQSLKSYSANSFQIAIDKITVFMSNVLEESKRYPELKRTVATKMEILARQITIGAAPARVELLYTKDRAFRTRITELKNQVKMELTAQGINPPLASDIELIQTRIDTLKADLAMRALMNKQVKQLEKYKYTKYEIEHMSQQDMNNILLYRIKAGMQIGPKVKF